MRILLVGAGGVGDAIAKIAARRDFFETIVVSDYDLSRAERTIAWIEAKHGPQGGRFVAAASTPPTPTTSPPSPASTGATHVMNAVEPKFVPTIFAGALAAGADYLDMAMSLSEPHPDRPVRRDRRQARRRPVRAGARLGDGRPPRARRHGRRARASATCSRATPPTTCSARSTSSAPATARTWWCATRRATRSSRRRSASGRRSRSASTRPSSGRRTAAGTRRPPFSRAGGLRLPRGHRPGRVRQRRARGGAAHAALGRREARHLQVRPRRRVHRRPARPSTSSASTRPRRCGCAARTARSRSHRATSSRRRCPTRRPSARG